MKERVHRLYAQMVGITLLMAGVAIVLTSWVKMSQTWRNLYATLQAAVQWTRDSNDELQDLATSIAAVSVPIRVTFLMDSGLILADSQPERQPDKTHFSDPEIAMAREGKTGKALRLSLAAGTLTLYMAQRVSPQLIVRLSYPVLELAKALLAYGALLLLLFLLLYLMQRRMLKRFTQDQERQFKEIQRLLDGDVSSCQAVFPEFKPALEAVAYRLRRLREDQEEIIRTLELREDFVANASHELRSPLTSVKGFTEMLQSGLADTPEERQLCLEMISSGCERMLHVIEDILLLHKVEKAQRQEAVPIQAEPVAKEVSQALSLRAAKEKILIQVEGQMEAKIAEKDLWEILYNLVDNAVRYGQEGGKVQVLLKNGFIQVQDDGPGIGKDHLSHLFEPFYRVDEGRGAHPSGTGLGLPIVKALAERWGASIEVKSWPGMGSCFTICFPEEEAKEGAGT